MEIIIIFLILLYSIIFHEIAHGYVAYKLGDLTAKYEGRLSLNPLVHLDIFGTIILPLITLFTTGFIFGYAKPVPYNPYNLKNFKRDSIFIALAGPLTNIILVLFFSILYKIFFLDIFIYAVRINLILAIFNLLPIPPLDGSKLLLLKMSLVAYQNLELFGFIVIFIFIWFFFPYLNSIVNYLQNLLI